MKKSICIVLIMCLIFSGCSAPPGQTNIPSETSILLVEGVDKAVAEDGSVSLGKTEEEIQDGERKMRRALKLALTAVSPDVTYASIELWIDAQSNRPLKGKFYAESSRLLKTVYYRKFQLQLGAERPTESVIIDGLNPQAVTLMRFSDYSARNVPEIWMQRDYLPRFQPE